MEFNVVGSKGMQDLITYFSDPKNHKDADTKHVSQDEFKSAAGKVSREADQLIEAIVYNNDYQYLVNVQSEGLINDDQVSLRDMWTSYRGTDYKGGSLAGDESRCLDALGRAAIFNRAITPRTSKQVVDCGGTYSFDDVAELYYDNHSGVKDSMISYDGKEAYDNRLFAITVRAPKGFEGKLAAQPWIEGYSNIEDGYAGKGGIVDGTGTFDVSLVGYSMRDGQANLAFKFVSDTSELNNPASLNDPDVCSIMIQK